MVARPPNLSNAPSLASRHWSAAGIVPSVSLAVAVTIAGVSQGLGSGLSLPDGGHRSICVDSAGSGGDRTVAPHHESPSAQNLFRPDPGFHQHDSFGAYGVHPI